MTPDQILDRAVHLRNMHRDALPDRHRFKSILNGGEEGIAELLGTENVDSGTLPAPNLMLSALDRLAQKIGKTPSLDVQITNACLLYTSPSPRDVEESRMPSSA